jgi:uncharacterized lipoprotein YajG
LILRVVPALLAAVFLAAGCAGDDRVIAQMPASVDSIQRTVGTGSFFNIGK